jgi:AcrR family transcriptional regulator
MGQGGLGRSSRVRASHQLPPGRHGLSRDAVVANQRQRILDAVADVCSLVGYQAMSVEAICAASGISRRTFYDLFGGKEDAFLAAYDAIANRLIEELRAAARGSDRFAAGVVACVRAFLELVAAEPRYADVCIVEVLAAGPAALARRNAVMEELAALLHKGAQTLAIGSRPPELTAEALIGGIYEVVYARVVSGDTGALPALLPDLSYSILLPYLGHRQTVRELKRLQAAWGLAGAEAKAALPEPAAAQGA